MSAQLVRCIRGRTAQEGLSMGKLGWMVCGSFLLSACTTGAAPLVDSGLPDSGPTDAGPDAGPSDSGVLDSGVPDAGPVDAGLDSGAVGQSPWPTLPGDAVMNPVSLVTIVASNDSEAASLFLFSDALVTSSWWSTLAEAYGSDAHPTS